MKYKDFSHNSYRSANGRGGNNGQPKHRLLKSVLLVLFAAVSLYGLKLLITPIVSTMASFFEESSTAISYVINKGSVKQGDNVTNTLLIGVDKREYLPSGVLTDTLIVLSYNHKTQRVTMLSLPRDLWITDQATKINGLYSMGGIDLLKQNIEEKLGIPIHYYALVGFEGFEKAVDTIGGVNVYVERTFDDYRYPRPGYENATWGERWQHVRFEQGWQHMDGKTALAFARSRHSLGPEGSDFARARRQQRIILAVKEKIMSSDTLFNIDRLRTLYLTLGEYVETDLKLGELPLFYQMAKQVGDGSKVETFVLDSGTGTGGLLYTPDSKDFGGAYVLVPRAGWESVKEFVQYALYQRGSMARTAEPTTAEK